MARQVGRGDGTVDTKRFTQLADVIHAEYIARIGKSCEDVRNTCAGKELEPVAALLPTNIHAAQVEIRVLAEAGCACLSPGEINGAVKHRDRQVLAGIEHAAGGHIESRSPGL